MGCKRNLEHNVAEMTKLANSRVHTQFSVSQLFKYLKQIVSSIRKLIS